MVAHPATTHGGNQTADFAPPDPRTEARRLLQEGRDLMTLALDEARKGSPERASELVGKGSDRVGAALHFLRLALRR